MKELLILRHAKSSWKRQGLIDHLRPLNHRGLRDAPRVGRWIKAKRLQPDIVLCSDATRARSTLELVAAEWKEASPVRELHSLYLASPATYLEQLSSLDETHRRAMVVGHNPGLEELNLLLTGQEEFLPTAALVHIRLGVRRWRDIQLKTRGELVNLWRPKELPPEV